MIGHVIMTKQFDKEYAEHLECDHAYLILESKFKETKKQYVDKEKIAIHYYFKRM